MVYTKDTLKENIAQCMDIEAIEKLLSIVLSLPNIPETDSKGGFLAVHCDGVMTVHPFGEIPSEKVAGRFRNATEKVTRIVKSGELRSFMSRDESKEQWGGGVSWGGLEVAFSGLPEKLDEAISFVYAGYVASSPMPSRKRNGKQYVWMTSGGLDRVLAEDYPDNEFIFPAWIAFAEWANKERGDKK